MFTHQLLDNHSAKEYLLLQLLRLHDNQVSKIDTYLDLEITPPTLKQVISRINDQYHELIASKESLASSTGIDAEYHADLVSTSRTHVILHLPYDDDSILKELCSHWLSDSLKCQLFHALFLHGHLTRAQLADSFCVSFSTLNSLTHSCNSLLKEYHLSISNNKMQGTLSQYLYFYFHFYWTNLCYGTSIALNPVDDRHFSEYIHDVFHVKLTFLQQLMMQLWFTLFHERREFIAQRLPVQLETEDADQLMQTCLYSQLLRYFTMHWSHLSYEERQYYAYMTFKFINSFSILDHTVIKLSAPTWRNFDLITRLMTILEHYYDLSDADSKKRTESALYAAINKMTFFHGHYFLIDQFTMQYKVWKKPSRFTQRLVHDIIHSDFIQQLPHLCIPKQDLANLLYLIARSVQHRKKVKLCIGSISRAPIILVYPRLMEIQTRLAAKYNITVEEYQSNHSYDFIISDMQLPEDFAPDTPVYMINNIYLPISTGDLDLILEEIEEKKYQSLLYPLGTTAE